MRELLNRNVCVLVDVHGPLLGVKRFWGKENHLCNIPFLQKEVDKLVSDTDEELEKRVSRVVFEPERYMVSTGGVVERSGYKPPSRLLLNNNPLLFATNVYNYLDYIGRYKIDLEAMQSLVRLNGMGVEWEFHTGIPRKWANELGKVFKRFGFSSVRGIMKPSPQIDSLESKMANIEGKIREGKDLVIVDDDPYLIDLYTKIWPITACFPYDGQEWSRRNKGKLDPHIHIQSRKGVILLEHGVPQVVENILSRRLIL